MSASANRTHLLKSTMSGFQTCGCAMQEAYMRIEHFTAGGCDHLVRRKPENRYAPIISFIPSQLVVRPSLHEIESGMKDSKKGAGCGNDLQIEARRWRS
jgi:hypothetical protein